MDSSQAADMFTESLQRGEVELLKEAKTSIPWQEIYKLEDALQQCQISNRNLAFTVKEKISQESCSIRAEFVTVRDEYERLISQVEKRRKTLEDLKEKTLEENARRDRQARHKLNQIAETEIIKMNEIKKKIEKRKWEHDKKMEELSQALELTQAAIDLERDEVETSLRKELVDINMQIWRQMNRNFDLQATIDGLKTKKQLLSQVQPQPPTDSDVLNFFQLDTLDDIFEQPKDEWSYGKSNHGTLKLTSSAYRQQNHSQVEKRMPVQQKDASGAKIREMISGHQNTNLKIRQELQKTSGDNSQKYLSISNKQQVGTPSKPVELETSQRKRAMNQSSGNHNELNLVNYPISSETRGAEFRYQEINSIAGSNVVQGRKIEPNRAVHPKKSSSGLNTISIASPSTGSTENTNKSIKKSTSSESQEKLDILRTKYSISTSKSPSEERQKLQASQTKCPYPTFERQPPASFLTPHVRRPPVEYTGSSLRKFKQIWTKGKAPAKNMEESRRKPVLPTVSRYEPVIQTIEVRRVKEENVKEKEPKKSKRRKLFDPSDLSYLDRVDMNLDSSFDLTGK
ncbi:uncharacterized protein LOC126743739 [Anthonomus grandis grandis]|uniref:uncharacterized protein LOC126743739 n=1 Tax=Anthonomus grandis grandis TaxID=2921223 RepID=UPI00216564D5|nr:uncharacterized protein LOC126743739 [Anthonomus grandis grandis]